MRARTGSFARAVHQSHAKKTSRHDFSRAEVWRKGTRLQPLRDSCCLHFKFEIFNLKSSPFPSRLRRLRDCHKSNSLSEPLKEIFGRAQRVRRSRTQGLGARSAKPRCLSACQTRSPCTLARATNPRPPAAKRHRCLAAASSPKRTTLPRSPLRETSRNHRRGSASQLPRSREERPQDQPPRRSPLAKWRESFRQESVRVPRRALQRKIPATAPRAIATVEECQKTQQAGLGNQPWKMCFARNLRHPSLIGCAK